MGKALQALACCAELSQWRQSGRILSWPPTSHTVNEMFLYSTVSTLKPMVGMVVTCAARKSRMSRGGKRKQLQAAHAQAAQCSAAERRGAARQARQISRLHARSR